MHGPGDDAGIEALLRLNDAGGAVAPRRALLVAHDGDAASAIGAGERAWRRHGVSAEQAERLARPDAVAIARGLAWLAAPRHRVLAWTDPDYPGLLRRISAPPLMLFVAGDAT